MGPDIFARFKGPGGAARKERERGREAKWGAKETLFTCPRSTSEKRLLSISRLISLAEIGFRCLSNRREGGAGGVWGGRREAAVSGKNEPHMCPRASHKFRDDASSSLGRFSHP